LITVLHVALATQQSKFKRIRLDESPCEVPTVSLKICHIKPGKRFDLLQNKHLALILSRAELGRRKRYILWPEAFEDRFWKKNPLSRPLCV
jgi:hypothetical protein